MSSGAAHWRNWIYLTERRHWHSFWCRWSPNGELATQFAAERIFEPAEGGCRMQVVYHYGDERGTVREGPTCGPWTMTADECRSAVAELREAAGGFGALLQRVKSNKIPKAARDNLEARKLEEHRRFCEEFITRAGAHLRAAEEAEAAAMASKAREAAAVEAELAKQEAARVKKEAEERERQEALERRARENNARFAEMKAKWAEKGGDGEGRGKKRKKGAKDESPEDEQPAVDADVLADAGLLDSDDDDGMGNEFNAAAKEAEANAAIAAAGLEESDDEKEDAMEGVSVEAAAEAEDITKAELAAAGLEDTDDDDEALVPAAAGGTDGGAEPAKRRRVGILDDDDE